MASLIEWLRRPFASLGRHESSSNQWVEPGNAITRSILAGAPIDLPDVEPSPLTSLTADTLDLSAFDEKPIPPLGVEAPFVRPLLAPAWEPIATPTAAAETPRPRVAERDGAGDQGADKAAGERKRRRWWRAA